jgi:tripartite-type tricarboxylate transporter receptor subunit TctC
MGNKWQARSLGVVVLVLLGGLQGGDVIAQGYPERPVRIIVPYPPGSGIDIVARIVGQKMTGHWGQQLVVENRPGAGAIIGVDAVAKATADGYTVGIADTGPLAINPALYPKLPYNPVRDFAPVTLLANLPFILVVHPSLPANSVTELIALAKSRPGKINYASVGNGSAVHLATELFKSKAGVDLVHIPYKGSAPALNGVLAGEASVMFVNLLSSLPQVKAGKLRALAVATSKRTPALPELPTIGEAGLPGYEFQAWFGIVAPAGTTRPVVERLNAEFRWAIALADVREQLLAQGGIEPVGSSAESFAAYIRSEVDAWGKLVRQTGAHVD